MKLQKGRVYVVVDGCFTNYYQGQLIRYIGDNDIRCTNGLLIGSFPFFTDGIFEQIVPIWSAGIKVASEKQRTQFKRQEKKYKEVIE